MPAPLEASYYFTPLSFQAKYVSVRSMKTVLLPRLASLAAVLPSRALLHLETLTLRRRLATVTARDGKRLRFRRRDRYFLVEPY